MTKRQNLNLEVGLPLGGSRSAEDVRALARERRVTARDPGVVEEEAGRRVRVSTWVRGGSGVGWVGKRLGE